MVILANSPSTSHRYRPPHQLPRPAEQPEVVPPDPTPPPPDLASPQPAVQQSAPSSPAAAPPAPLARLRVGQRTASRDQHVEVVIANEGEFAEFLNTPQPPDTNVEIVSGDIWVFDADTHHWKTKPTDDELAITAQTIYPLPPLWFRSHGYGIKAFFIGARAMAAALSAAMALPQSFNVETMQHFRHPRSVSAKHGCEAGLVHIDLTRCKLPENFTFGGTPSKEQIEALLSELGMVLGGTYSHDHCPIAGDRESDAGNCVIALNGVIYCHRCAAKGDAYTGVPMPGVAPYRVLVQGASSNFDRLARHLVHWLHAQLELNHLHRNCGPTLLREAYRLTLESMYGADDPRIAMVFNPNLTPIKAESGWIDSQTGLPTHIDDDWANALPAVNRVVEDEVKNEQGEKTLKKSTKVVPLLRSNAKYRAIPGYTPMRPYRGLCSVDTPGVIPFQQYPRSKHPVCLLDDPLPWDEAWAFIQAAFPGMSAIYLQSLVIASFCVEVGQGQAIHIAASGPAGSGKGETITFAASLFADCPLKTQLDGTINEIMRSFACASADGTRFVVNDEISKIKGLESKMSILLQISSQITSRALYTNGSVNTQLRSVFVYPCTYFADYIKNSNEFGRRSRAIYLPSKVPNWRATSGGDTLTWRDRNPQNARVGNSILTHCYQLAAQSDFNFKDGPECAADRIGIGHISDGSEGTDPENLRQLYRYARGQLGERQFTGDTRKWLDLSSPNAKRYLAPFQDGSEQDVRAIRRSVETNLQAISWNDILGIADPPITCAFKAKGGPWSIRFQQAAGCMRGQELVNETLPPIPGDCSILVTSVALPAAVPPVAPISSPAAPAAMQQVPDPVPAEPIDMTSNPLAAAGFPV